MVPLMLTAEAVSMLDMTMVMPRSHFRFTPRVRASFSPKDRIFSCQLSSTRITAQTMKMGAT